MSGLFMEIKMQNIVDPKLVRTQMQIGEDGINHLKNAGVAIFGLGGVGGHVLEVLARSGVGKLYVFDNDEVSESNLNRQILATYDTLGMKKTKAATVRVKSLSKDTVVVSKDMFVLPENIDEIDFSEFDYVVDAIDTVSGKIAIIEKAKKEGIPVISSMGTGNKMKPEMLEIADIFETSVCPLARVMRKELKDRGIDKCKVVYSKEEPQKPLFESQTDGKKIPPASNAYVPAAAGILIGSAVIRDLLMKK